ncbi:hypothetical protein DMH03_23950 [Amycolatopsis sp. WAC 01376]|uniref:hypothetical protein n=1 Tax=Amycolatopsis sp. WAC 01376 TaxID=2203195 RepID=UPI000F79C6AA|nr:hypothetical protein [Amycolatopsis sp. WAC 01376]RSM58955.1 hypothetical protein DMH03_23950 [Amycolatopsis sp. WAC 01376]
MKLIAFIIAAVTAWLAWGAGSLHQKNPAEYSLTPALLLGLIAVVSLLVVFTGKSKAKAK